MVKNCKPEAASASASEGRQLTPEELEKKKKKEEKFLWIKAQASSNVSKTAKKKSSKRNGGELKAFVCCPNDTVEIIKSRELEISTLATLSSLKVSLSLSGLVLFDLRLLHLLLMVSSDSDAVAPAQWPKEDVVVVSESHPFEELCISAIWLLVIQCLRLKVDIAKFEQYQSLAKIMSACGYKEKVLANVHEENTSKLGDLKQQLESYEENIESHTSN
ncbi:hypothetical protein RND71_038812 [Anisodus tanguticus]|uniref:Uncharacterized protein n=1 Tax=Anisodus tanguticus TaxID=243964 RepID=A0AAE1R0Y5_9SOLA|nr:hypothetical protein RND71_038812 [Anisodus tanguticus]